MRGESEYIQFSSLAQVLALKKDEEADNEYKSYVCELCRKCVNIQTGQMKYDRFKVAKTQQMENTNG